MRLFKKITIGIFLLGLSVVGTFFLNMEGSKVLAATVDYETSDDFITVDYSKTDVSSLINEKVAPNQPEGYSDWIFAGWYAERECKTTVAKVGTQETYYAKFVPENVLSVKCQVPDGITSANYTTYESVNMRFVTSIDTANYERMGFEIYVDGENKYPCDTQKAYRKIKASSGSGVEYKYSSKVIDTKSEAFVTYTITNIPQSAFDTVLLVKPYWVTCDGTTVYGVSRYVSVSDSYNAVVNIPVKVEAKSGEDTYKTTDFSVLENNSEETLSGVRYNLGENYASLVINGKTALSSVTKYTVTGSGETTYLHRNLNTEYKGEADTSWYTVANQADTDENEYVIATSADLYGLASVVNGGETFLTETETKTVYMVCDIAANKGTASINGWTPGTDGTHYTWTPIGAYGGTYFSGVFDGQGHAISGIYLNNTASTFNGLFGATAGSANIHDFKLKNSYFYSSQKGLGSIAGIGNGTLHTIYSDAIVVSAAQIAGGLVGQVYDGNGVSINNCWFDGTVINVAENQGNQSTGGFVGYIHDGNDTMINCLMTGTVDVTAYSKTEPWAGGLVGRLGSGANLEVTTCLNVGKMELSDTVTGKYGAVVGYNQSSAGTNVTIDKVFATAENCIKEGELATQVALADIKGTKATSLDGFDFDNSKVWLAFRYGIPVLKSFKDEVIDTSWYNGATGGTYYLYDKGDLYGLAALSETNNFMGMTIKLANDIVVNKGDAEDWASSEPSYDWYGTGYTGANTVGTSFAGVFDGQGHTISGIYMNTVYRYGGLFRSVSGATLRDFRLVNSYFNSTNTTGDFGGLVGYVYGGTINSIYSDVIVTGVGSRIGGMIGHNYASTATTATNITNCWYDGTVSSTKAQVAGFIGSAGQGVITLNSCLNTGTVDLSSVATNTTNLLAGGIVGNVSAKVTMTGCLNTGEIIPNSESATGYGPIVGYAYAGADKSSITKTYATNESCVAGKYDITTKLTGKTFTYEVTSTAEAAIKGSAATTGASGLVIDNATYWRNVSFTTPVLATFYDEVADQSWYTEYSSSYYYLYDRADFYGFADLSQAGNIFAGNKIRLVNDIVVNDGDADDWTSSEPSYDWWPIGYKGTADPYAFAGTFDGQGHTISGIYADTTSTTRRRIGLFGATASGSMLKDFRLKNSYFTSKSQQTGSIAGVMQGTVQTVYSDATVVGGAVSTGGLFGLTFGSVTTTDCWYDGYVSNTTTQVGGLVGNASGTTTMNSCLNTGTVDLSSVATSTTNLLVGGMVGNVSAKVTMTGCLNTGEIIPNSESATGYGPIVGYAYAGADKSSITKTYATNESCVAGKYDITTKLTGKTFTYEVTSTAEAAIKGSAATTGASGLVTDNATYWRTVSFTIPVLTSFYDEVVDTNWYDGVANSTYYLYDKADLYGFAELSKTYDFEGMTVKLAKDITINNSESKEEAAAWATSEPSYSWTPIGIGKAFKGTFDGDMHTINGIYLKETSRQYGGLFEQTDRKAVIKNLNLTNSYLYCSTRRLGSIAGVGNGTFSDIYSNATVVCGQKNVGGLVGQVGSGITMSNCWFDGSVTNEGNSYYNSDTDKDLERRRTGGLIGYMYAGELKMSNCLNSGEVNVEAYDYDQNADEDVTTISPLAGGLIGTVDAQVTTATIQSCLNVGEIQCHAGVSDGCGPIIGHNYGKVNILRTYATEQCIDKSNVDTVVTKRDQDAILEDAEKEMPLLDWGTEWQSLEAAYPIIRFSGNGFVEDTSSEIEASKLATLTTYYQDRALYQGEAHDHALNDGASDGHKTLAEWYAQINNGLGLDLDFAASLDHHMTSHYAREDWNKDLLIYGTEAGSKVSKIGENADTTIEFHYNMVLPSREKLENVLKAKNFNDKFKYTTEDTTGNLQYLVPYTDPVRVTYGQFVYPDFTKTEFQDLIQEVKNNGGFFTIPHPTVSHEYSVDNVMNYYFADEVGFEVIYGSLTSGSTKTAYRAWLNLLKNNARVWATAGKDNHRELTTDTLTSIYATKLNTEKYMSEAYVRYFRQGNFVAGSVGIQMCIGDTQMGGTGSFDGKKLEIGIGDFHDSVYDSTHQYRVDVWYEDSIVYSQELVPSNKSDALTYIAMDTDKDCKYYRVEVYDVTNRTRIAIGNPIWNADLYSTTE